MDVLVNVERCCDVVKLNIDNYIGTGGGHIYSNNNQWIRHAGANDLARCGARLGGSITAHETFECSRRMMPGNARNLILLRVEIHATSTLAKPTQYVRHSTSIERFRLFLDCCSCSKAAKNIPL
jgi:hypothetical protein